MFDIKHSTVLVVATIMSVLLEGCALFQQTLPGVTLSDANVLSVLNSLSEREIAAARLAQERASAPEVHAFAGRVLNEHRQSIEATERLATQLGVEPRPPALVSHLNEAHEEAMRTLRATSGPAFDRAYVEYEIQHHVTAFNFVEAAAHTESTPVLRQDLTRTGPDLLSHISAARALERHLGEEPRSVITAR